MEETFTFLWQVKNFSMCPSKFGCYIESPVFRIRQFGNSEWSLRLYARGCASKNFVSCYLSCKSLGFSNSTIKIEYYLIVITKSLNIEVEKPERDFKELETRGYDKWIERENIFKEKDEYIPKDTLTIKCSMKCNYRFRNLEEEVIKTISRKLKFENSLNVNKCCCETTIPVQTKTFLWPVQRPLSLSSNERITVLMFSSMIDMPSFYITLYKNVESDINIEITRKEKTSKNMFVRCTVSAANTPKGFSYCLEDEFLFASDGDVWTFPHFLNLNMLEKDGYFKPNENVLFLQFDFAFSIEGQLHHVEKQDWKPFDPPIKSYAPLEMFTSTSDDDNTVVTLRAEQRTYTVHKALLKSKSEVFLAMFENDMKEKETGVVDIPDVDPHILGRLLSFLYTGTDVADLSVADVQKLYAAANKYQVLSLIDHCSAALKTSLSESNVCEILEFAALYRDEGLLKTAEDFIFGSSDRILLSQDWKNLMENNLSLASSIMYKMLIK